MKAVRWKTSAERVPTCDSQRLQSFFRRNHVKINHAQGESVQIRGHFPFTHVDRRAIRTAFRTPINALTERLPLFPQYFDKLITFRAAGGAFTAVKPPICSAIATMEMLFPSSACEIGVSGIVARPLKETD